MFEFDKSKSESNRRKDGIDFEHAKKLWEDPNRIEIPARWVDEDTWSAIFTLRKNKIRIISVRKSRDDEKEIYNSSRI